MCIVNNNTEIVFLLYNTELSIIYVKSHTQDFVTYIHKPKGDIINR